MEQQDTLANKVSRQIPMVSADLDTIQARIHDAEGKADKMTAMDVRNTIDDIESASRVRTTTPQNMSRYLGFSSGKHQK